jgi:phosphoglycerate kinase
VDFNVPIKNGKIEDDFRIKKAIPSIKFLIKNGAKVILITHLGKDGRENLEPIIKYFFKISKCAKSQVIFFENIRKFDGEMKNSPSFAKKLSTLGDIYVNEAFSVSHRMHASVVGLPKFLPSYAGFQFEEEVKNLSHTLKKVKHPFLFILGGAKFSTKMPVIQKYLKLADYVFIGGALANDLLKAKGYEIGKSLVDDTDFNFRKILQNKKLILPEDVLVRNDTFPARAGFVSLKKVNEVKKDEVILDIGNETVKNLAQLIKKSKLVLWNGPLGKYESGGEEATKKILKLVARAKTESIIGGGDIVSIVSKLKMEKKFTFVSTGGGATLDFLINGTLPGIKALK